MRQNFFKSPWTSIPHWTYVKRSIVLNSVRQSIVDYSMTSIEYPATGMPPPIFPGNANMICASPEGSSYPVPFSCFAGEPPAPGSLLDRTIRAINFSVPSSVDANGSDLPFSGIAFVSDSFISDKSDRTGQLLFHYRCIVVTNFYGFLFQTRWHCDFSSIWDSRYEIIDKKKIFSTLCAEKD